MTDVENFRSALHGFNRTDVVQFIQQQTAAHEKAMRQQKEEISRLQDALEEARKEVARLNEEKEELEEQLKEREAEPQEEPAPALDEPMTPVENTANAAPSDFNEMELAAYRRAELTERMARERAAAAAERMKAIFEQAGAKLEITQQDVDTLCETFRHDFEQLLQVLETAQAVVSESSSNLKAAETVSDEV